jgi:hypothetical protein
MVKDPPPMSPTYTAKDDQRPGTTLQKVDEYYNKAVRKYDIVLATSNLRAEDGLTVVGKLAKELQDDPGRLRVKTRGRLVQEQEELRLYHHTISISLDSNT